MKLSLIKFNPIDLCSNLYVAFTVELSDLFTGNVAYTFQLDQINLKSYKFNQ